MKWTSVYFHSMNNIATSRKSYYSTDIFGKLNLKRYYGESGKVQNWYPLFKPWKFKKILKYHIVIIWGGLTKKDIRRWNITGPKNLARFQKRHCRWTPRATILFEWRKMVDFTIIWWKKELSANCSKFGHAIFHNSSGLFEKGTVNGKSFIEQIPFMTLIKCIIFIKPH